MRNWSSLSRRQALAASAGVFAGGSLTRSLQAADAVNTGRKSGKAKSVIMLYLHGGAPTQDMFRH